MILVFILCNFFFKLQQRLKKIKQERSEEVSMEVDQQDQRPAQGQQHQSSEASQPQQGMDFMHHWTLATSAFLEDQRQAVVQPLGFDRTTKVMRRKIDDVTSWFQKTLADVDALLGDDFFEDLIVAEQPEAEVINVVEKMSREFQSFAFSHR